MSNKAPRKARNKPLWLRAGDRVVLKQAEKPLSHEISVSGAETLVQGAGLALMFAIKRGKKRPLIGQIRRVRQATGWDKEAARKFVDMANSFEVDGVWRR